MPAPLSQKQRQIADLEALVAQGRKAGLPDDVKFIFTHNEAGDLVVEMSGPNSAPIVEAVTRSLIVKVHDPDKPSNLKAALVDGKPLVDWLDSERKRRDKPKKSRTDPPPSASRG
jgi:hypothetical protein